MAVSTYMPISFFWNIVEQLPTRKTPTVESALPLSAVAVIACIAALLICAARPAGRHLPGPATRRRGRAGRYALPLLLAVLGQAVLAPLARGAEPPLLRVVGDENYPPFLFLDPDGNSVGYVADWWQLWSRKTGVPVELRALEWAAAQRAIADGKADVIDNIFRTPAREALYEFTGAYAEVPVGIFVSRSIAGIQDTNSLRGFQVGVMAGDACVETLRAKGVDSLRLYPSYAALIDGALADEVRIFCLDDYPAAYYMTRANAQTRFVKAFQLYEGHFHRAVPKGRLDLLKLVETGAAAISAEEDAELRRKWMPPPPTDYGPQLRWLAGGLAALVLVALGLFVWLRALRRAVRRQTAELEAARALLEQRVAERTSELVRAAASLGAANAQQQAIFDAANAGIVLMRDRCFVQCNQRMLQLTGYTKEELIGRQSRMFYPPDKDWEALGQEISAVTGRGETFKHEEHLLRKDGSSFWARLAIRAIDPADLARGVVAVVEDISEERAATQRLIEARSVAEAAARIKSDFLANMSHEIRTPMNAVLGMTHLALRADPAPRQRDYLLKIQRSSRHLLGIINDILDFSKIEAGKLQVEEIDFALEQVLDNLAELLADKPASKNLELLFDVAADVPTQLVGDPLRIGQVLINFLNNAVKFTEQGEIVVRVEVAARSGQEVMLRFAVRDTGIGISEAQRPQLFQSFQQVDTSTTRKYGGTGLGLVIAKRLAELMGGEVGVDSTPGVGSTFWFTARLGIGRQPATHFPGLANLTGRRLLVVDDNEHARTVIAGALGSLGFAVTSVASGSAALTELQQAAAAGTPYDIAFIDWQMPDLDGLATARAIRQLALPGLALAAMVTASDRDAARNVAATLVIGEVLVKPLNPSQLFEAVSRLLGAGITGRHPADPLPAEPAAALAGARVLLVEDNEINQEVATELLQEIGLQVDLAEDGAVALQKIDQVPYDLVLMDMQMPVMDGLTATREIRKRPGRQDLPIVAMTANAMPGDRERCLEAGMNDHIAKPIDPKVLREKLERWIHAGGRTAPAAPVAVPPPAPAPAGDWLAGISEIAGLDVAHGLHLVLGRQALYLNLLRKFVSGQADAPERLAKTIAAADWETAQREAHTLKGVAAQIGAEEIRARAERLEHAIRQRAEPALLETMRADLAAALPPLIAAIGSRLPEEKAVAAAATVDNGKLREIVNRLAGMLEADSFDSVAFFDEHESLLRAALDGQFARLAEAVRNYDDAVALDLLKRALKERGIEL